MNAWLLVYKLCDRDASVACKKSAFSLTPVFSEERFETDSHPVLNQVGLALYIFPDTLIPLPIPIKVRFIHAAICRVYKSMSLL